MVGSVGSASAMSEGIAAMAHKMNLWSVGIRLLISYNTYDIRTVTIYCP